MKNNFDKNLNFNNLVNKYSTSLDRKLEKPTINFSEETRVKLGKITLNDERKVSQAKQHIDKKIGKANQRRGNGRGCI